MESNTVPELVTSQKTVTDTKNNTANSDSNTNKSYHSSNNEFSTEHNGGRKNKEKKKTRNKEKKKKTVENNNNNDNDNSNNNNSHKNNNSDIIVTDTKSSDYLSNNDSSVTMETNGSKTVTTNATSSNNTWAAIDTLDDVRQLAKATTDSDNFNKEQENELNKMRQNQIKLLKLMIERNSKLQKLEKPLEESKNNDTGTDNIITFGFDTNNNNNNDSSKNAEQCDKDTCHNKHSKEGLAKPIKESTIKQEKDVITENEGEGLSISPSKISNQKSIYVSDYFETLDDVQMITRKESEYIEQMEKIIDDSRIEKLHHSKKNNCSL